jgi:hypothetical protein
MSPQPGVGVSGEMDPILLGDSLIALQLAAFAGIVIWRYLRNEPIIFFVAMITASEISERISTVIRNIILTIFEIIQPIATILGIGQIAVGLLLAVALRQEFIGYRLVIAGIITLIFVYFVVPFLLSFI